MEMVEEFFCVLNQDVKSSLLFFCDNYVSRSKQTKNWHPSKHLARPRPPATIHLVLFVTLCLCGLGLTVIQKQNMEKYLYKSSHFYTRFWPGIVLDSYLHFYFLLLLLLLFWYTKYTYIAGVRLWGKGERNQGSKVWTMVGSILGKGNWGSPSLNHCGETMRSTPLPTLLDPIVYLHFIYWYLVYYLWV